MKKFLVEAFDSRSDMEDRVNAHFSGVTEHGVMYRLHDFTETRDGYTVIFIRVGDPAQKEAA